MKDCDGEEIDVEELIASVRHDHATGFNCRCLYLCDVLEGVQKELALARGAMLAQDNREKAAGEKCGVLYGLAGCDWPDEVAEEVLGLRANQLEYAEQQRDGLRLCIAMNRGIPYGDVRAADIDSFVQRAAELRSGVTSEQAACKDP